MSRSHEVIVGHSSALAAALEHLSQLSPINRPALIVGERGTGKELAAERIHFLSTRWQQPLIKVNCAAISEQLLESELFGHEPGAFTGASRTHHGRFERADGGTLFLDELATMSHRLQEKLLRVIEYGEFERLGGQDTLQVDVRIVAATNADLRQLASTGTFREDLLDRLSFDVVHLPPLRDRLEDIDELSQHFAIQMCRELEWEFFPGFTEPALSALCAHSWPGNIRELKNVVERSVYRWANPQTPVAEVVIDPFDSPYAKAAIAKATIIEAETKPTVGSDDKVYANAASSSNFTEQVQAFEEKLLREALRDQQGHQGRTAQTLGLSYHQLRGLLRKHRLITRQASR